MKANSIKTLFNLVAIFIIASVLQACQQAEMKEDISMSPVEVSEDYNAVGAEMNDQVSKPTINRQTHKQTKLIKTASTRYKVAHVKDATRQIVEMSRKYDAYISDQRFQNNNYRIENRFTIKIPQEYFDIMMDSIGNIAEFIEYENISTKDVTEEYVDIQTRLKTKLEVKQRYETILRKNAKTVKDILATEEKLRIIQEEIESSQGRLKYLTNKVSYSTIQVDLYETVDYKEEPESYRKTFWSKSKNGLSAGWEMIEAIVIGLIYVWPLLIIGVFLFFFIRKKIKK